MRAFPSYSFIDAPAGSWRRPVATLLSRVVAIPLHIPRPKVPLIYSATLILVCAAVVISSWCFCGKKEWIQILARRLVTALPTCRANPPTL
jgi:hypothetical protein